MVDIFNREIEPRDLVACASYSNTLQVVLVKKSTSNSLQFWSLTRWGVLRAKNKGRIEYHNTCRKDRFVKVDSNALTKEQRDYYDEIIKEIS